MIESFQASRRVQRVRHEVRRRDVEVARVEPLGSEFVRVVFAGDSLEGFTSLGYDDHVKFIFGGDDGAEPLRRDYTPRHYDSERRELTIDFALHGDGRASTWARQARVGQQVVIGGPRGSMIVPDDYAWYLLAGDATAAPAIGRRLAELPTAAKAIVIVELADLAALELGRSLADVELHRVESAEAVVCAIDRVQLPPGEGYIWCAGESATMAKVRDLLLHGKGHPRQAMRVAAYWKRGASDFHEDLAVDKG